MFCVIQRRILVRRYQPKCKWTGNGSNLLMKNASRAHAQCFTFHIRYAHFNHRLYTFQIIAKLHVFQIFAALMPSGM